MSVLIPSSGSVRASLGLAGSVVALAALAVPGCRFDETGVSGAGSPDARATSDALVGDGRLTTLPDGALPDGAVPCVDRDEDSFFVPTADADCGELIDCDDFEPLAFPGQSEFFTEARESGGYDYDCDGSETPELDTRAGGDCYWDWFSCEGTGWYGGVPACGTEGIWHVCSPSGIDCRESDAELLTMPCR